MWTHTFEMVTGTRGKLICVGLDFLAQLTKTSKLDLGAVCWWEGLWENLQLERHSRLCAHGVPQFHSCCFRTYQDSGILFLHYFKITNKAEVPRHPRVFLLLFNSLSQRIVNDVWLYPTLVAALCWCDKSSLPPHEGWVVLVLPSL